MSWRAGSQLFWEIWPSVKSAIPDPAHRMEFTRSLLELFYAWDIDPCDVRGCDPEIDQLADELDPPLDP